MFGRKKITKEVYIDGMECMHCAKAAQTALKSIEGVSSVKIELENKKGIITSKEEISDAAVRAAIEDAGFSVTDIK